MSIKTTIYTLAFSGLASILGCKTPSQQEQQPTLAETFITTQQAETTETQPEKPIETQLEEAYQALPDQTYQTLTQQYATTEQKVERLIEHLINQHARSPLHGRMNIIPSFKADIFKAEIKTTDKYGRTIFYTVNFYSIPPTQKEQAELIKKKLLQQGLIEKEIEEKLYLSSLIITAEEEDATNWFFDQTPADGFLERTTINNVDYYRRNSKDYFQPHWAEKPPKKILTAKQIQDKYEQALDNILDAYELD